MSNYKKLRKIGEGTFGKAWLVEDTKIDKLFVIKEVKISKLGEKDKNQSISEVTILSKLKHPNVVSYIDSFIENSNLGIVIEYCEGGDLFSKIIAHKEKSIPFSEDQILEWFLQLTSALNYIHSKKILHRDLKSQNIFLKNGCVKLGDFGIARVLTNTLELAKTCIGTPIAFSPEIVQGEPYNHKSDIWGLGCVLYELTMLKLPFTSDSMNGLFCKILRANFEPIKLYYSQELSDSISNMLKRSPDRRPNTDDILRLPLFQRFLKRASNEEIVAKKPKVISSPIIRNNRDLSSKGTQTRVCRPLSRQPSDEKPIKLERPQQRSRASSSYNLLPNKNIFEKPQQSSSQQRVPSQSRVRDRLPSPFRILYRNQTTEKENERSNVDLQQQHRGRSNVPKWTPPTFTKNI